ncbi:NADH-ubiquinone oxidoreductase-F iron-sulfur binding region domain-containing protein [Polyangium sp. 15x6]|uniref:NADH-ubiquinone oxidoreductase-F iron-sulfur binding region domain-containing protein n=1 Tax=Polyangium sp. 15x6 TaxID=3042687 RepID=UPI00249A62ED|nr:NADH-ubiquinone oxidoreductase-F iron-sulfur binding region domain-containing protein [Polyangium sp. 15x6]MDI3283154.1 NADH-ubiquinone oxidoreductase-F iron-sulfur binding region domain-containing protein [Polyangium sp. 15x6]
MGAIIDALTDLQHEHGWLDDARLAALAQKLGVPLYRIEGLVSFYPHFRRKPPPRVEVALCRDVTCRLAGGRDFLARARQAVSGDPSVEVREVSCLGRCDRAPAAALNERPVYAGDLDDFAIAVRWADEPRPERAPSPPRRWASDPYEDEASRYGVLASLRGDALAGDRVQATLETSGLRGMGGAGFPTGLKWKLVRKETARPKYVVCNADESEPGTFKDRVILDELPHLVIEGMAIAALVVGASEGIVFIRHEYGPERKNLARAIEKARQRGALGPDALGPGLPFDVRIAVSPGGYILGEETALLECLEDNRGEPRNKPPFPGQKGLFGRPTLINNVETLSYVPLIVKEGAEAWKARGVRGSGGLKFIALSGDVAEPGVYQVPMGTTIGELIARAGGTKDGRPILAIAPGGASSNFLRADAVDAPLDFDALQKRGSMLGSGAVLVVCEGADIVDLVTNVVAFFRNESCGKCVPCRVGTEKAVAILEEAVLGRGKKRHLAVLSELAETLADTSICGLGQVAIAPFLSVLRAFEDDVRARFPED